MPIEINGTGSIVGVDSLSTPAVTNAAGSASAPSITFTGDTNTGLYSPGADQVAVTTGGTARLLVDASGRLLVGTTSGRTVGNTAGSIQIEGVTDTALTITDNSNGSAGDSTWLTLARTRGTAVGGTTAVSNGDWLGNLDFAGHNGSSFNVAARISGQVDGAVSGGGVGDMPGRLVFSTTADGASSPTERMRIASSGAVAVNTTTPSARFHINGIGGTNNHSLWVTGWGSGIGAAATFKADNTSNADVIYFETSAAQVGKIAITSTSTSYNTSSDYRLKENVTPVTDGITRLQQLKPSRFNFIADPDKTVDGFIAHEVQTVVPEAITGEKDAVDDEGNPVYQGIDQSKLVPLLTAALQEAVAKIESLEARLTAAGI